ncbi:hypothetical protein SNEBB_000520, partial [Seison nebaliae]
MLSLCHLSFLILSIGPIRNVPVTFNVDPAQIARKISEMPPLAELKERIRVYTIGMHEILNELTEFSKITNFLLFPKMSMREWENELFEELGTLEGMTNANHFLSNYWSLIPPQENLDYTLLNYNTTLELTGGVVMIANIFSMFRNNKIVNSRRTSLANTVYPFLAKDQKIKGIFDHRFLIIFASTSDEAHYMLWIVDWEKARLISHESLKSMRKRNQNLAEEIAFVARDTAHRMSLLPRFNSLRDDKTAFIDLFPAIANQKDKTSCGFYTLLNL